jgi:hypothetical protein
MSNPTRHDGRMGKLELAEIVQETVQGMTAPEMLATAEDFEQAAFIIRHQACCACEFCTQPFCARPGPWRN